MASHVSRIAKMAFLSAIACTIFWIHPAAVDLLAPTVNAATPLMTQTEVAAWVKISAPKDGDVADPKSPLSVKVDYEARHYDLMVNGQPQSRTMAPVVALELWLDGKPVALKKLDALSGSAGSFVFTVAPDKFPQNAEYINLKARSYTSYNTFDNLPEPYRTQSQNTYNKIAATSVEIKVLLKMTVDSIRALAQDFQSRLDPAADDDGDGLTNGFELYDLVLATRPDKADTDNNGVNDAQEDSDNDGIVNIDEQSNGTDPLLVDSDSDGLSDPEEINTYDTDPNKPDTDNDGLNDKIEIELGTDPNDDDTDNDGIKDGEDNLNFTVEDNNTGVSVEISGNGTVRDKLFISSLDGEQFFSGAPAFISSISIDNLSDGNIDEARITIPFNPQDLGNTLPQDLVIAYFDLATGNLVPLADQDIDEANNTVSGLTTHFSTFVLYDKAKMEQIFAGEFFGSVRGGGGSLVLVFDLDSSGSMSWNDPSNIRKEVSKDLIDSLEPSDKVGIVDFDDRAIIRQQLTTDKDAAKAAVDQVDSNGNTNIGAAVSVANNMLINDTSGGTRVQILLTDGQGSYSESLTQQAKDNKIIIYTIGLGSGINESLLRSIAEGTGGAYFQVNQASELIPVFDILKAETQDTDGDGISDSGETNGMRTASGSIITSDPNNPDTDSDGLNDGEEMGSIGTDARGRFYNMKSDPNRADSDGDGLEDGEEFDLGSNPMLVDTDSDGLTDATEENIGADPNSSDTDKDGYDDKFEDENRDDGYEPVIYNEAIRLEVYVVELLQGAAFGELIELDTVPKLVGSIAAGFAEWGDVTDILAGLSRGDLILVGSGALGAIPYFGWAVDISKGAAKVSKMIIKYPAKAIEVVRMFFKAVPEDQAGDVLKIVSKKYDTLVNAGLSNKIIARFAKNGINPDDLAKMIEGAAGTMKIDAARAAGKLDVDGFFKNWRGAEDYLRNGTPRPGRYPQPPVKDLIRYPDAVDGDIVKESKMGFVKMSDHIKKQIEKDARMIELQRVGGAEWHFFPSGRSGTIGADQAVIDLLKANNIPYYIHIP